MSIGGIRIQRSDLPAGPSLCGMPQACPYRVKGVCDQPRVNKSNSDAGCRGVPNKIMVRVLVPLTAGNTSEPK